MGVAEERAAPSQPIDVWRLRLGMPSKAPDPIIEVVDGNEKNVRSINGMEGGGGVGQQNEETEQGSAALGFHEGSMRSRILIDSQALSIDG